MRAKQAVHRRRLILPDHVSQGCGECGLPHLPDGAEFEKEQHREGADCQQYRANSRANAPLISVL